jgi:hypothetical protein
VPVKSKEVIFQSEPGYEWVGPCSTPLNPATATSIPSLMKGTQELLESEGHDVSEIGDSLRDIGGPFSVVRREITRLENSEVVHNRSSPYEDLGTARNYSGRYYALHRNAIDSTFPAPVHPIPAEMNALGTTAIARTIPTNPISGLTVALGELRKEGIPSLVGIRSWEERAFRLRNAGDEYLNYQFGWVPLLNDIQNFYHATQAHDEIVRQYERGSGQPIRRRYNFTQEVSSSTSTESGVYPNPASLITYFTSAGTRTTETTIWTDTWFSGCYTYYLPPYDPHGSNFERNSMIASKLFGARITPKTLWDLSPWTWAADWVTNAGDFLTNVSAFQNDGLVLRWGYIMRKRVVVKAVRLTGVWVQQKYCGSGSQPLGVLRQNYQTTVKSRLKATPYGFGLDPSSFTSRQWAILTALGLSRSGSKLG